MKTSPTIDTITLVTPFRDLGIALEDRLFLEVFKFGSIHLACTQRGKEEVRQLFEQLDINSTGHLTPYMSFTSFHFSSRDNSNYLGGNPSVKLTKIPGSTKGVLLMPEMS